MDAVRDAALGAWDAFKPVAPAVITMTVGVLFVVWLICVSTTLIPHEGFQPYHTSTCTIPVNTVLDGVPLDTRWLTSRDGRFMGPLTGAPQMMLTY